MYCLYTYINLASVIQSLRFWTLVFYGELSLQGAAQINTILAGRQSLPSTELTICIYAFASIYIYTVYVCPGVWVI